METHHFAVGVFAEPRSQFNGAHEDKEETQREGKGDEGYSPGRGHLSAPAATRLLNGTTENRTVSPGRCMGGGGVGGGGWATGATGKMATLLPDLQRICIQLYGGTQQASSCMSRTRRGIHMTPATTQSRFLQPHSCKVWLSGQISGGLTIFSWSNE